MTKSRIGLFTSVFAVTASCSSVAVADGRSTGQMIEYEILQTSTTKTDYSNMPASIRAQAEHNQAAGNGKKITTNVTMTVDSIDADGNAHVNAKYIQSMEGVSGAAASVFGSGHEFQGIFTADGRVLPTINSSDPTTDSHGRMTAAGGREANADAMKGTFADFNTFITGASKRSKFKVGDIWHLTVQDAFGITRQYDFSVLEADSSNASAALIAMKCDLSGESSSAKINANGHYDSTRRILSMYHEENVYANSMPNGMSSSGVMVTDINLRK